MIYKLFGFTEKLSWIIKTLFFYLETNVNQSEYVLIDFLTLIARNACKKQSLALLLI